MGKTSKPYNNVKELNIREKKAKKRKYETKTLIEDDHQIYVETCKKHKKDKRLKHKSVSEQNAEVEEVEPIELSPQVKKVKTDRKSKLKVNEDHIKTNISNNDVVVDVTNNKVLSNIKSKKDRIKKNKNKIVTDDERTEIYNQTLKAIKTKNSELSQEDDVNDEDIDKFCDELSEEDNAHYNNWVELIEAKLNTNKKKAK